MTPVVKDHIPQQLGEKAHLRIAWSVGDFMLLFARWQPTTWRGAVTALCFLQTSLLTLHHKSISYGHQKYRIHCVPIAY